MTTLTELNRARIDVALDTALTDPHLKLRLKGFIIDSFMEKYEHELVLIGLMLNQAHPDKTEVEKLSHYQDLITEQLILFINNKKGDESPMLQTLMDEVIKYHPALKDLIKLMEAPDDATGPDPS